MKKCPFCQKSIRYTDIKCRYCGCVLWFNKKKNTALNNVVYFDNISTSPEQLEPLKTSVTDENNVKIKKMRVIATVVLVVLYIVVFIYNYIYGSFTGIGIPKNIALMIGAFLVPSIAYIVCMIYPKHIGAQYVYYISAILLFMLIVLSSFYRLEQSENRKSAEQEIWIETPRVEAPVAIPAPAPPVESPAPAPAPAPTLTKQEHQADAAVIRRPKKPSQTARRKATPSIDAGKHYKGIKGIVLMNGNKIEGQIISMNSDTVKIRTKKGTILSYDFKKEVESFIKE